MAQALQTPHPDRLMAAAPSLLAEARTAAPVFEAIAKALRELGEDRLAELCFTDMMFEAEARAKALRTAIAQATGTA